MVRRNDRLTGSDLKLHHVADATDRKADLSNKTALALLFKVIEGAQKSWRCLDGHAQLLKMILGVKFADGWRSGSQNRHSGSNSLRLTGPARPGPAVAKMA